MRKFKHKFLTVKEIREYMRRGEPMPTAIFSAEKRDYGIVQPRTIWGMNWCRRGRRKGCIRF